MAEAKDYNKLPRQFLQKLEKIFPQSLLSSVLNTFGLKRPTTFRINRIKTSRKEALLDFKRLGLKVKPVPWYQDAFVLLKPGLNQIAQTRLYLGGKIYVQSLSSMLPPLILNPQPQELILDLTAAPGSKTTQLASLLENQGKIVAIEKYGIRFEKLLANLRLQGVENVDVQNRDAIGIWREYFEKFDKVLLDAPCTTEARFNIFRPKSYLYWSQLKVKRMAKKQKGLIVTAFKCLKPGGLLLYSTCTFSPEENEFVINYLKKKFPGSFKVERIKLGLRNLMSGIISWNGVNLSPEIKNCIRVIPTELMEGFFLCLIRKLKSLQE